MDHKFRIVFQGGLREGLDPALVRQQAAARLKASPAQIERIFSGARVVLKQQLDAAQGFAYQAVLEKLGMIVALEEMAPALASSAASREETPKPAELCQFQRTHINLARAEALLNGTDPTRIASTLAAPLPVPARPSPVVPRAAAEAGAAPNDAWMHESGFVSLERAQKKLADAAAQFTPATDTPAQAARQSLPETVPRTIIIPPAPATRPPQIFSSLFQCSHCGTEHRIESRLQLNITPLPAGERAAS